MRGSRRRVKREDFSRILLTETATYDVPLTFSNLGFYWHWKKFEENKSLFPDVIIKLLIENDSKGYTIPFHYKVRKNETSYRQLALIHPKSQISFIEFYKKFDSQILLGCSGSRFSIRYPSAVGSKYYSRENPDTPTSKYKSRGIAAAEHETATRYLTSYFAYQSHTRLHRFFDSSDFRRLEKKFMCFWSLDIARCFDSVYTHSITWALKNKGFSKNHRSVANAFGAVFDRLMQAANYNETAGIIIGPEVSRIFTEIILQEVDHNVLAALEERGLTAEKDYAIRRYVDDMFIFTSAESSSQIILSVINDALKEYKFNLNASKTKKLTRPFITDQSRAITLAKLSYKALTDKLFQVDGHDPSAPRKTKYIFNRHHLLTSFLLELKAACSGTEDSYAVVAGYILAVSSNLLIGFCDKNYTADLDDDKERARNRQFIFFILELVFHLHTLHPTSNSSVKIGIVIQRACAFFETHMPEDSNAVRSLIYTLANESFESGGFASASKDNDNASTLEALNLMIALKGLGDNFSLAQQVIEKIVDIRKEYTMSYFEIVALLYYIGHDKDKIYKKVKDAAVRSLKQKLDDISDLKINSEKAHLLLDALSCPYLEEATQIRLIQKMHLALALPIPTALEISALRNQFLRFQWFTTWRSVDIVNNLEKKALLPSY